MDVANAPSHLISSRYCIKNPTPTDPHRSGAQALNLRPTCEIIAATICAVHLRPQVMQALVGKELVKQDRLLRLVESWTGAELVRPCAAS